MAKRPIQSYKAVINNTFSTAAASQAVDNVSSGVDNYSGATKEVPTGAVIKALRVNIQGINSSASVGAVHFYVALVRGGQTAASFPDADTVGLSNVRNQIFHQEMQIFGTSDGKSVGMNRLIKIPKHMQRVREGDKFYLMFLSSVAILWYFQVIYKFYR